VTISLVTLAYEFKTVSIDNFKVMLSDDTVKDAIKLIYGILDILL